MIAECHLHDVSENSLSKMNIVDREFYKRMNAQNKFFREIMQRDPGGENTRLGEIIYFTDKDGDRNWRSRD